MVLKFKKGKRLSIGKMLIRSCFFNSEFDTSRLFEFLITRQNIKLKFESIINLLSR